ncbi:hypothetical protein OBBRIDRAFT_743279 [Obba rivulosa]|uniref:Uncharacterized protein n=1 Tax=Obba rivulosa TaxID=1052685 RepID=A0A8E2DVB7_9APHY|nr:hypothetical protein OBBRIDRAFT_743279 [Obba rivulosa]
MSAQLDRKTLESMRRADLQRLCKDHGIKANLKSEALIDLLLDTTQPLIRHAPVPGPSSRRASSMRVVSRSTAGIRPRGHSGSSMIIHDTDEEEESDRDAIQSEPEPQRIVDLAPRKRKAKETQFRLGVGRPALAGGSGAREITRSVSVPRTTRGRGSRSRKPTEVVIQEEDEGEGMEAEPSNTQAGDASRPLVSELHAQPSPPLPIPSDTPPQLADFMTAAMSPIQEQMQTMQTELRRLADEFAGLNALKLKLSELTAEVEVLREKASQAAGLEAEVQSLKSAMSNLKLADRTVFPSHVKLGDTSDYIMSDPDSIPHVDIADISRSTAEAFASGAGASSTPAVRRYSPSSLPVPASLLGKRHRPADEANDTGVFDVEKEDDLSERELAQRIARPSKKRAKLSERGVDPGPPSRLDSPAMQEDPAPGTSTPVVRGAGFTVFSGPEESIDEFVDRPLLTTRLSDLFIFPPGHTPPPIGGDGPVTETANANENRPQQNAPFAFNFTNAVFQAVTSTPAPGYGLTLPAFSYPEPPTSPTPAGPSGGYIERAGGRRERNDLFHPHGAPRRPKSAASTKDAPAQGSQAHAGTSASGTDQQACVNPSALLHTPSIPEGEPPSESARGAATASSSTAVGAGLGMGAMPLPPETPALPMKRTMYGTELEGDTRFGDFGVEGVATGFWAGGAPRF